MSTGTNTNTFQVLFHAVEIQPEQNIPTNVAVMKLMFTEDIIVMCVYKI